MESPTFSSFVAFVAAVLFIGLWMSKGEETDSDHGAQDYFLAGRKLTWWLVGFSLIAANISTEQFVGMSGQAADWLGMAIASYEWMAAITLVVVAFVFLPTFLRSGIYTIPEFLEYRYNAFARFFMAVSTLVDSGRSSHGFGDLLGSQGDHRQFPGRDVVGTRLRQYHGRLLHHRHSGRDLRVRRRAQGLCLGRSAAGVGTDHRRDCDRLLRHAVAGQGGSR